MELKKCESSPEFLDSSPDPTELFEFYLLRCKGVTPRNRGDQREAVAAGEGSSRDTRADDRNREQSISYFLIL
jgi:hypothetical protein